jgi:hypothetical protein
VTVIGTVAGAAMGAGGPVGAGEMVRVDMLPPLAPVPPCATPGSCGLSVPLLGRPLADFPRVFPFPLPCAASICTERMAGGVPSPFKNLVGGEVGVRRSPGRG